MEDPVDQSSMVGVEQPIQLLTLPEKPDRKSSPEGLTDASQGAN